MSSSKLKGVMLNAYPDSIGKDLSDIVRMLQMDAFEDAFSKFYILPTFFNSDLDRGFSIIDYDTNDELVAESDIADLKAMGIDLKFDIVLNHLSVASPQFKDLLQHGEDSEYIDFFIDWNKFWEGNGEMNDEGVMIPKKEYLDKLFMRKSDLPVLKVKFPDGSYRPYWNTFYQKVDHDKGTYLGQMDVNAKSPLVWEFYEDVLAKVKGYGCSILRLDAFAYLHKEVGEVNFFNKPGTWDYLAKINDIATRNELELLPEIHSEYGSYLHDEVAKEGYVIYDFFLPGLIIHAIEFGDNGPLISWAKEIIVKDYKTVNMLGCHDGIPVLDLKGKAINGTHNKGLLEDDVIEQMIELILERGGTVKNLYGADGQKISYYQVNATYYSALGESDRKMLLARALQLFMPGIPQVWYLDIFCGRNDSKAVKNAGVGGHKEINRTTLSMADIDAGLQTKVVQDQLKLLRLRNTHPAFDGVIAFEEKGGADVHISWVNGEHVATLYANLKTHDCRVIYSDKDGEVEWEV